MNFKLTAIFALSGALLCWNNFKTSAESRLLPVAANEFSDAVPSMSLLPSMFDNQNEEDEKFILFVNEGVLNIKCNRPVELINGEIIIYNLLGQEVIRKRLESNPMNFITLPLQNSCYIVKIHYSGNVYTKKIIVNS